MTIAMPDTSEIVKGGTLTPAGIQLLTGMIDAQNGLAAADLTDEQVAFLAGITEAEITASGAVEANTLSSFDTNWLSLLSALLAGTATNAQIQEALQITMLASNTNYVNATRIIARVNEIEDALIAANLLGET
jgi:hypothetical protein